MTVGARHQIFRNASRLIGNTVTVVKVEAAQNVVIFHSDSLLCDMEPILRYPGMGEEYFYLGWSNQAVLDKLCVEKGMIISPGRTAEGFHIGYPGESLHDQGGGCFALTMPETLLGIYVGIYKPEGDGAPVRAGIIPASYFNIFLLVQFELSPLPPSPSSIYISVCWHLAGHKWASLCSLWGNGRAHHEL